MDSNHDLGIFMAALLSLFGGMLVTLGIFAEAWSTAEGIAVLAVGSLALLAPATTLIGLLMQLKKRGVHI